MRRVRHRVCQLTLRHRALYVQQPHHILLCQR